MATQPTFVKRSEVRYAARRSERPQLETDPYLLRPLPGEDVFFYSKRIDNARVVRQANPARGACWSAAGVMCLLAVLLTGSLAPRIANLLAGYRVEALRQEQQRLVDERMMLDVEEARLERPDRLQQLARGQNLVPPKAGQLVDLEPKGDASLASLNPKAQ
jgi:hypothetical protein